MIGIPLIVAAQITCVSHHCDAGQLRVLVEMMGAATLLKVERAHERR